MSSERVTLLLKDCTVYDGTGASPFAADIGISGDTIAFVGKGSEAQNVIDLKGLSVSPGFIDVHSHSDFTVFQESSSEGKVFQGVTTEVNGNCGLSAAPLYGDALKQREKDIKELEIPERWNTFNEYFDVLERRGLTINFATLAGHGNIRASVMGYTGRKPTGKELDSMKHLLGESLKAGAIGLSTGLIYPPGIYTDTGEIIELVRYGNTLSEKGFIYTSHIRSEGQRLLEAIEEIISVGRETGAKVHISHIKTAGRENWHKIDAVVSLLESARSEGISLSCDRYPYTAASTELDAVLPAWVFEGGNDEELKRLKKPEVRKQIKNEVTKDEDYWQNVCVSSVNSEKNKWMEGKSIKEISIRMGCEPMDAVFNILIEEGLGVDAIFYSMSEDNLKRFLSLPYVMIGSDSAARSLNGRGKPHPRGFGTFPRFLRRYASGLSSAIQKITMLPAHTFGLKRRGQIKKGFIADIVVFNPERVIDRATFDEPFVRPEGIYYVIVNGVPVLSEGVLTGKKPGRVLRHGR